MEERLSVSYNQAYPRVPHVPRGLASSVSTQDWDYVILKKWLSRKDRRRRQSPQSEVL
jgi:hypothetical protein